MADCPTALVRRLRDVYQLSHEAVADRPLSAQKAKVPVAFEDLAPVKSPSDEVSVVGLVTKQIDRDAGSLVLA